MTYHLSRVMHWQQQQSLSYFPTPNLRELHAGPWAEMAVLQGQILIGRDRLAASVQWIAMIGCLIGVSYIAKLLGGSGEAQALAAFITVTIPMGILQSTSTQTDYVVSLWLVCLAAFSLESMAREATLRTFVPDRRGTRPGSSDETNDPGICSSIRPVVRGCDGPKASAGCMETGARHGFYGPAAEWRRFRARATGSLELLWGRWRRRRTTFPGYLNAEMSIAFSCRTWFAIRLLELATSSKVRNAAVQREVDKGPRVARCRSRGSPHHMGGLEFRDQCSANGRRRRKPASFRPHRAVNLAADQVSDLPACLSLAPVYSLASHSSAWYSSGNPGTLDSCCRSS